MWTIARIRKYIFNLPRGELFTTRDLLVFGRRATVDQALYRMVKANVIIRIAWGVFVLPDDASSNEPPVFTARQVAEVKAQAFNKEIACHGADAAKEFGLIDEGNSEPTYAVSGRTSSFRFRDSVIHLIGTARRKIKLGDSLVGLAIRALWHLGRKKCDGRAVKVATKGFGRSHRQEFKQAAAFMPSWLTDIAINFST